MMDAPEHWPALSFLECLRPGTDESVELALLASYSADLGVVGATLLALAGKDSDSGRGSPSDFAEAVERLRGKVRIVIQRGRLANMRKTPRIASVLDQFVREVGFDEAVQSWHPKVALVRLRCKDGTIFWRLWIGSRNLTEGVNRDLGLLLVSNGKDGELIHGIDDLAHDLASKAMLKGVTPTKLTALAAKVKWRAPLGIKVERIHWSGGGSRKGIPVAAERPTEVIVVSPFVDATFLSSLAPNAETTAGRKLLTTMSEIERVGPAIGLFGELHTLEGPNYPPAIEQVHLNYGVADEAIDPSDGQEQAEVGMGLHAKLLFIRTGKERRLWIGSANATMRAWTGRNTEVMAELLVTDAVEQGLRALLGSARVVAAPDTAHAPDDSEREKKALESARAQVAARWDAVLRSDDDRTHLAHHSIDCRKGPHPDESDILLEAGSLHGELVPWPREQVVIDLGPTETAHRSEFVRLRVSRGGQGLSWLQRAPADPPLGEARDRAALVRFLGSRGFFLWLGGLLADDGSEQDGDWTAGAPEVRVATRGDNVSDFELPTLEEMLAAWARDATRFQDIDRRISRYLPAILEQATREEPEGAATLRSFEALWRKIQAGLRVASVDRRRQ